ncbi:hypothetical protein EMCRGX_G012336 [Ephydatia muelleri]
MAKKKVRVFQQASHFCLKILPTQARYMERRGIEVGQVELMLYVKPLQEKRCAGGHFLELVVCEWALLEVEVRGEFFLEVVMYCSALSGRSGARVGSLQKECTGKKLETSIYGMYKLFFTVVPDTMAASPGPVGNMTVTSPSVDQLTVTWTPPTTGGVPTSYSVTINDSSSPVVIADNGSPVYTHTFTGLVSDTLYTVSVVAINCAGSSNGTSLTKSGHGNMTVTRPSVDQLGVTWTPPTTVALPPDNTTVKAVSVFNPNNTLRHLEITWTPVGGAVTICTWVVTKTGPRNIGIMASALLPFVLLSVYGGFGIKAAGCPSFNINYPPLRTLLCPGDIITYTCALSSGQQIRSLNTVPGSCGNLSAVMTSISGTCYTSVLTIPTPQYFNGTTVTCRDGFFGTLIGSDTLNIQLTSSPGAPSGLQNTSLCTNSLTIQWTSASSGYNASSYNISVTSGTTVGTWSVAGHTTMTTIGDLIDGTNYTVSVTAINCAGSSNSSSVSVQTFLYQNNSVYDVELFWTHRQQSCSVPQYTVMVTSATSTDTYNNCTSSSCLYILGMSGADVSSYNVSMACRNTLNQIGQPYVAMQSVPTPVLQVGQSNVSGNTATIPCTFLDGSSHYCMVCCSPSLPVGLAGSGYLSSTSGPSVSVSLQGLTSGQMYYCKAAATNTNSNNCTGPVVGGVKVFFSFISGPSMTPPTPSANGGSDSSQMPIIIGVTVSVGVFIIIIIVIILIAIYMTRITGKAMCTVQSTVPPPPSTLQNSVGLTERSFQDEVVSREAGQSYCSPGGGYEDIAGCRKTRTERHPVPAIVSETTPTKITLLPPPKGGGAPGERCAPIGGYDDIEVVRAVKIGGVASGDRMEPSAVATNTQQATYAIPDQTKKASGCGLLLPWLLWICVSEQTSSIPQLTPKGGGAPGERCAPIGGYEDIVVVRAVKLGGVASGDRMEPSAVATNTQQATYTVPDRTKKASGCGLLLPWLLWICVSEVDMSGMFVVHGFNMCQQVLSMTDTPPPLPAPLKEGDDGPPPLPAPLKEGDGPPPLPAPLKEGDDGLPVAIYALCGPATDDRDEGVAIGCGYLHGLTTSFEEPATTDPYHTIPNRRMTNQSKTSDHAQITEGL